MNGEITGKFIKLLNGSSFGQGGACRNNRQCRIENVRVDCGETYRRRRDTSSDKQRALTVSFFFFFLNTSKYPP